MTDQFLTANQLQLCFDEFGSPEHPALLLIMGLGTQMTSWTDDFCQRLAAKGFRVVRFDNRDVGLSQKIEAPPPGMLAFLGTQLFRRPLHAPYMLADMAADAVGVLDALSIKQAHIVGASMGGMIAQILAAKFPDRALSLTSIMSTSGARHLPQASAKVTAHMLRKRGDTEEQRLKSSLAFWRIVGSPGYPPDEQELAERIVRAYRRNHCPQGYIRQLAAITASGDRVQMLSSLDLPTLVIHGADDKLIPLAGGKHTAELVSNAQLKVYPGMGHDIPQALYDNFVAEIASIAGKS